MSNPVTVKHAGGTKQFPSQAAADRANQLHLATRVQKNMLPKRK
jgi:hypothetical protein